MAAKRLLVVLGADQFIGPAACGGVSAAVQRKHCAICCCPGAAAAVHAHVLMHLQESVCTWLLMQMSSGYKPALSGICRLWCAALWQGGRCIAGAANLHEPAKYGCFSSRHCMACALNSMVVG